MPRKAHVTIRSAIQAKERTQRVAGVIKDAARTGAPLSRRVLSQEIGGDNRALIDALNHSDVPRRGKGYQPLTWAKTQDRAERVSQFCHELIRNDILPSERLLRRVSGLSAGTVRQGLAKALADPRFKKAHAQIIRERAGKSSALFQVNIELLRARFSEMN